LKALRAKSLADRNVSYPTKDKSFGDNVNYNAEKGLSKYLRSKIHGDSIKLQS